MITVNNQGMVATVHSAFVKTLVLAGALLTSTTVSAKSIDEPSLAPFSAASIGIVKKADVEQAAEQERQALNLLQQSTAALAVDKAAAVAVKSLAPSFSAMSQNINPIQLMGAAPLTREQVIVKHASQPIPSSSAASEDPYLDPVYHSFTIYDASSRLLEDVDYDGFYQTFSVTFDVDVIGAYLNERADLFAELYLSRNGGPWLHYFTTDIFSIYGESTQDDYQVLTTLYSGYATDHYDVLIDVYEVGYSDIVATISADETDSLYALPLESRDRDRESEVIVIEQSGGALSISALIFLGLYAGLSRRLKRG